MGSKKGRRKKGKEKGKEHKEHIPNPAKGAPLQPTLDSPSPGGFRNHNLTKKKQNQAPRPIKSPLPYKNPHKRSPPEENLFFGSFLCFWSFKVKKIFWIKIFKSVKKPVFGD